MDANGFPIILCQQTMTRTVTACERFDYGCDE